VTGPVVGDWQAAPPPWYDGRLRGVLSLADWGEQRVVYQADEDPRARSLSGGNVALRRQVWERVGGFHPALGKITATFAMGEDSELFLRLRRAGWRGLYEPQMKVLHLVPRERLTRSYFRAWHRGYGKSVALLEQLHPQAVRTVFGIPRFLLRQTLEARGCWRRAGAAICRAVLHTSYNSGLCSVFCKAGARIKWIIGFKTRTSDL
jgi:GT2 family glycosyltransferase